MTIFAFSTKSTAQDTPRNESATLMASMVAQQTVRRATQRRSDNRSLPVAAKAQPSERPSVAYPY